jgi:hypothetical protein
VKNLYLCRSGAKPEEASPSTTQREKSAKIALGEC